jgi:hypothetical protein
MRPFEVLHGSLDPAILPFLVYILSERVGDCISSLLRPLEGTLIIYPAWTRRAVPNSRRSPANILPDALPRSARRDLF